MTKALQSLPLATAKRIDALCDHFEAAWKAGKKPRIETYLGQAADDVERQEILRCLMLLELELQSRGGTESVRREYLERFAKDAPVVESVLRDLASRTTSEQRAAAKDTSVSGPSGATPSRRQPKVPLPKQIGRFEVLQLLGQGAFGRVYRARDPQLEREVAIKVPIQGTLETEEEIERFLKEARTAATLHHPNICPVHEVGQDQGQYFIVMALLEGKTMAVILKDRKEPLPARQVALLVRKLALTLDAAHAKGIVHRDMKPANILIEAQRKDVIVMDFGLARYRKPGDTAQTLDGVLKGTPAYMSPEQAAGDMKQVGPASDIYSLGVILYELLTGRLPFAGTLNEVLGQVLLVEPEPPSKHRPDVDKALEAICLKAMAKEPAGRYRSAGELASALGDYLKGEVAEGPKARKKPTPGDGPELASVAEKLSAERHEETRAAIDEAVRRSRTPAWLVLSGLGFLAVLIVAGVILLFTRTNNTLVQVVLETRIDPELLRDGTVSFYLNGNHLPVEELGKPIELKPGEHVLVAKRGEAEIQRYVFVVRAGGDGKEAGFEVKEQTPPPAPSKTAPDPKPPNELLLQKNREVIERHWPGKGDRLTVDPDGLHLNLRGFKELTDLTPLEGMPLVSLNVAGCNQLRNLSPLKGMKLTTLNLADCYQVSDLTPLKGMPLQELNLYYATRVRDLTPLKGLPLTKLSLWNCPVSDLTPLKGLPLTNLSFTFCIRVRDLSPLEGLPLKTLGVSGTSVTDLTPLKGMSLEAVIINAPNKITQGLEALRDMKSLQTINIGVSKTWPAAEFWKKYDAGEFQ